MAPDLLDLKLAIYYIEERQACLKGDETTLSQLPRAEEAFFRRDLNVIPTDDQTELYECWESLLEIELERTRGTAR